MAEMIPGITGAEAQVTPDPKTTASVIGNFQQVVKKGELRLYPIIARLVDREVLERMQSTK